MSKLIGGFSKRAISAMSVLSDGGCFHVFDGRGFHGQPTVCYELLDCENKKVKGFGLHTMREIESMLDKGQDEFGFDHGFYRMKA